VRGGAFTPPASFDYSSVSSLPSVGLCLSGFVFFAATSWEGLGLPTRSRAISRTILAAEKIFFLRLRGMVVILASGISKLHRENAASPLIEGHPHLRTFDAQKCNNLRLAWSSNLSQTREGEDTRRVSRKPRA